MLLSKTVTVWKRVFQNTIYVNQNYLKYFSLDLMVTNIFFQFFAMVYPETYQYSVKLNIIYLILCISKRITYIFEHTYLDFNEDN